MSSYCSTFYGDISPFGYKISYLLISRNIRHDFVLSSEYFFVLQSVQKTKQLAGFEDIWKYMSEYKYIFDFPEIDFWNS